MTLEDITGAQEALMCVGIGPIDSRVIASALDKHPDLAVTAQSWGWTDTEVRDGVAKAVCRHLLDITEDEYLARLNGDERALTVATLAAHDAWLVANPPQPGPNLPEAIREADQRHIGRAMRARVAAVQVAYAGRKADFQIRELTR